MEMETAKEFFSDIARRFYESGLIVTDKNGSYDRKESVALDLQKAWKEKLCWKPTERQLGAIQFSRLAMDKAEYVKLRFFKENVQNSFPNFYRVLTSEINYDFIDHDDYIEFQFESSDMGAMRVVDKICDVFSAELTGILGAEYDKSLGSYPEFIDSLPRS